MRFPYCQVENCQVRFDFEGAPIQEVGKDGFKRSTDEVVETMTLLALALS